jgi:hypothetical protein
LVERVLVKINLSVRDLTRLVSDDPIIVNLVKAVTAKVGLA